MGLLRYHHQQCLILLSLPMSADKKRILRTCCTIHLVHDGLTDMLYALLPLLREAFGLSYADVALVRSSHRLATALFQIPASILSERFEPRILLAFGTLIAGIGYLGLSLASGYMAILTFIFLSGCGAAFQHPLSSGIISNTYPDVGQRSAIGIYNAFGDIGKMSFLGLTVFITAYLGSSWHLPTQGAGLIAMILAGLVLFFLKRGQENISSLENAKLHEASKTKGWGIKDQNGFYTLSAIAIIDSMTRTGFLTFVAFLMIEKGITIEWAASGVFFTAFGGMCGRYAVGLIAEKLGVAKTIMLTEVATSILIFVVLAVPSLLAFLLLPVLGVFLNGTSSAIYGTVSDLADSNKHSRAFGVIYTLGSVCGTIAPLLYGILADRFDIETVMIVAALTILLTVPLCWKLQHRLEILNRQS